MRREQVVGAVVYGQFVPEESTHPSVPDAPPVPVPGAPVAGGAAHANDAAVHGGSGDGGSGDGGFGDGGSGDGGDVAGAGVAVAADGVTVDAEGNPVDESKFLVRLDNFTGPFDLLLQLIGKHKLDVTEVALHQVTDDFIAYIRAMGDDWDLGEASEFLLVAATLLDLKAARLLPAADVEDEEDLALLEARDLLFARLLQYKAYKEAAAHIMELEVNGMRRWPRMVSMEPRYAEALPDLVLGVGPERLFKLALKQFTPKPGPPQVSIAHIHQVRVSVREHAALLRDRLRRAGQATFTLLVADCDNTLEVVARFLALLELYREGLIDFEQPVSLDELTVRWIGGDAPDAELDIDDYEGTKPEVDTAASEPGEEGAAASEPGADDPVAAGRDDSADDLYEDDDDDSDLDAFDVAPIEEEPPGLGARGGTADGSLDDSDDAGVAGRGGIADDSDGVGADAHSEAADDVDGGGEVADDLDGAGVGVGGGEAVVGLGGAGVDGDGGEAVVGLGGARVDGDGGEAVVGLGGARVDGDGGEAVVDLGGAGVDGERGEQGSELSAAERRVDEDAARSAGVESVAPGLSGEAPESAVPGRELGSDRLDERDDLGGVDDDAEERS
ncbi:condensin subunit ScpA [Paractinoplanes brasiliensis]|uniref:Segregation and condensation protein A n=1 Tax=Paractinoplanes brasiliensis TaxID=52695 RepID=A0A4R6JY78_9ACTN|nr:condensin subunit ScpA [Actinoplanes brasiliensis]GID29963.1 hypothetical protein Abr02nite_49460 [Actinoplanes brasiliensis]